MEFRILGPLEVDDGERVVPLRPKQRALLAALLLRASKEGRIEFQPFTTCVGTSARPQA